jgi:hypothetical protein
MSRITTASLFIVTALAFAPIQAEAQGPPAGGGGAASNVSARLAALEAKVARLEGNITSADLVGTYRAAAFTTDLDGLDDGTSATVTMFAYGGTMTLADDGTGVIVQGGNNSGVIQLREGTPWTDTAELIPVQPPIAITEWSYADGVVHITDGTVNLDLYLDVAAGGRILTWAGLSDDNTADIIIATRLR